MFKGRDLTFPYSCHVHNGWLMWKCMVCLVTEIVTCHRSFVDTKLEKIPISNSCPISSKLDMDGVKVFKRPEFSFVYIIWTALINNPEGKMTLNDIYDYITEKHPFFNHPDSGSWKNSVWHALMINDCFMRVTQNMQKRNGKWTLHLDCEGMFQGGMARRRKNRFVKRVVDI